jgi:protein-disulfide isomerase
VLTRREFNTGVSVLAMCAVAGLSVSPAFAQRSDTVPAADLAKPSPLGDMTLGKEGAPITIIEYASMGCPHCAHFALETFPKLKEKYIDTGKVRYTFREFPLDSLAAAASMLMRCTDKEKFFPLMELLFKTQEPWYVRQPIEPLFNVVKQTGYSREAFNACLDTKNNANSQKILAAIESTRNDAADKLGVNSTPTFFINGKRVPGALSLEEMEKEMAPYLKA